MRLMARGHAIRLFLWNAAAVTGVLVFPLAPARGQITTPEQAPSTTVQVAKPQPAVLVGLIGFGGFHTYNMEELNETLADMNVSISQLVRGVSYEPVDRGGSVGGGVRLVIRERLLVQLDLEHLVAHTSVGGVTLKSEIEVPADAVCATLGWDLMSNPRRALGVAVGVGRYTARGTQTTRFTPPTEAELENRNVRIGGSVIGPHYGAYFDAPLSTRVFVSAFAGYRNARLDDPRVRLNEDLLVSALADPDEFAATSTLDWSGVMARVGFTYYMNFPDEF